MCIDFFNENAQEAKFSFGYKLESIGPTTFRTIAKLHICGDLSNDTHFGSVALVVALNFTKKRGATLNLLIYEK